MNNAFYDMLYFLSCSAHGLVPERKDSDPKEIFKLAHRQGVGELVYDALKQVYTDDWLSELEVPVYYNVMQNTKKLYFIHKVFQQLDEAEIPYCLLKGETLSALYANPALRISSDIDLYIEPKLQSRAYKIFKKNGFEVERTTKFWHHDYCTHPAYGLVEVHRAFCDDLFDEVWFGNSLEPQEPYIRQKTEDGYAIQTMSATDGAIFVCFHLIKHFLSKGVGVRQILDTLLYFKHYKNEIDWERFSAVTKEVQYDTFIEYLKGIGIHYLQFNEEDFESYLYDEKICAEILEDCRLGGTFGYDAAERAKFYQLYTHRRFLAQNGTEKEYKKLMNKWTFPGIRLLLFGLPDILKQSYPYCKKHPILLPVAVVHRWIDFILQLMRKEAKVSTYLKYKEDVSDQESIQKRLDLIEEMKMI